MTEYIDEGFGKIKKVARGEQFEQSLTKDYVKLGNSYLIPHYQTTMDGYFKDQTQPKYVGRQMMFLYFFLEEDAEFAYYLEVVKLTDCKFFIQKFNDGGYDYNFSDGKWDW